MAQMKADPLRKLVEQGKAMPANNGPGRFPIRNQADLEKAIRAVGRVRPSTDEARAKVRLFIVKRARELNLTKMIPDTWNQSDGSLKTG